MMRLFASASLALRVMGFDYGLKAVASEFWYISNAVRFAAAFGTARLARADFLRHTRRLRGGDSPTLSRMSCPIRVHIVSADTKFAAPLGADYLESIGCGSVSLARDLYFQTP
jgi:hypothetical protein